MIGVNDWNKLFEKDKETMMQEDPRYIIAWLKLWWWHGFESWLVHGDPSLGLPTTLVEEIGLKIVVSRFNRKGNTRLQERESMILTTQAHIIGDILWMETI
jgi:hypothetical protein